MTARSAADALCRLTVLAPAATKRTLQRSPQRLAVKLQCAGKLAQRDRRQQCQPARRAVSGGPGQPLAALVSARVRAQLPTAGVPRHCDARPSRYVRFQSVTTCLLGDVATLNVPGTPGCRSRLRAATCCRVLSSPPCPTQQLRQISTSKYIATCQFRWF